MTPLHGIAIRDRRTKRLITFVECDKRYSTAALSRVRSGLHPAWQAEAETLDAEIVADLKRTEVDSR